MRIKQTGLGGVLLIQMEIFSDQRGYFMESYNYKKLYQAGIDIAFLQDNHSLSVEVGVIRGLHYQLNPKAQTKLVRVVKGAVFDVVVDIRRSSPNFGKWISVILSEENKLQLFIPKGFAHGLCTVLPGTEVIYKVDDYYSPEHEQGIIWNDPELSIDWPVSNPILSDKDRKNPSLKDAILFD